MDRYYTEEMHTTRELLRARRKRWVQSGGDDPAYEDSDELKETISDCELEDEIRRDVSRTVRTGAYAS